MHLLDLNEDVFDAVLPCLNSADLFRLSSTCRSLRRWARSKAIATMRLRLSCSKDVTGILTVFTAQDLLHVKDIHITLKFIESGASDTSGRPLASKIYLARLLACTQNLRRLSIEGTESLLASLPTVRSSISRLCRLEHLQLLGMESRAVNIVADLQCSSLRSLVLLYAYDSDSTEPLFAKLKDFQFIESLKLGFLPEAVGDSLLARPADCTWPSVQNLYIAYSGDLSLWELSKAFPNICFLHLRCTALWQDANANTSKSSSWWPCLRKVCGYHSDFALWPAEKSVYWLILEPSQVISTGETALGVTRVVELVSPTVLSFDVLAGTTRSFWTELVRVGRTVRYLDVLLIDGPTNSFFFHFLDVVPRLLQSLGIVCLCLRVVGHVADYVATVGHNLKTIPSLRYFGVGFAEGLIYAPDLSRQFDGEVDWWRVSGSGAHRKADALPRRVGEALSDYLCDVGQWPTAINEDNLPNFT